VLAIQSNIVMRSVFTTCLPFVQTAFVSPDIVGLTFVERSRSAHRKSELFKYAV
jgi:hypothetical protein